MSKTWIDLRSDTVTRPTPEMRQAIAEAEVGDDVFGDDPTIHLLEEETARILGKEAALFVPSGTMANEVAVSAHTERGDEVILEEGSHIFMYEGAGPAILSGVQLRPLRGEGGMIHPDALLDSIRPDDPHFPVSRLLCLENSHNRAGGRVLPLEEVLAITELAAKLGLRCHLDGARLWNAAVASGKTEAELAAPFDSVSVCFSKGLGAPVGSALAGPRDWIAKARRIRKVFGGGMRQAGILRAAALHAMRHHRDRLAEDHARARHLAEGLGRTPGLRCEPAAVDTNIVIVEVLELDGSPGGNGGGVSAWLTGLEDEGVLAVPFGGRAIRMVTHLDVGDDEIERAIRAAEKVGRGLESHGRSDQAGA